MPDKQRESSLTDSARRGDKNAFGDLYERYLDQIYRYIYYRVNNLHDAEDLTEQVFLKAWEKLPQYRGEVPFRAWIYRIAHNAVIDHYRTRKELAELPDELPLTDETSNVESHLLSQERAASLAAIIARLSPLHQHVLTLRFINGLSMKETAQVLGRNVGAIRVLQHRALKAAQTLLTAEEITHV
ncbi:MAG TPA: sigma-70 family RNA polymerase sigma factor [Anaerolineae bacterium]|nr:sigma-70 family RNA polymerase sigma factor [Anaerolineae bacterium]